MAGSVVFAQETCSNRRGIADYDSSLVTDRALLGLVTDWEGFLQSPEKGPMKKRREATRTGRPAGEGALGTTAGGDRPGSEQETIREAPKVPSVKNRIVSPEFTKLESALGGSMGRQEIGQEA